MHYIRQNRAELREVFDREREVVGVLGAGDQLAAHVVVGLLLVARARRFLALLPPALEVQFLVRAQLQFEGLQERNVISAHSGAWRLCFWGLILLRFALRRLVFRMQYDVGRDAERLAQGGFDRHRGRSRAHLAVAAPLLGAARVSHNCQRVFGLVLLVAPATICTCLWP